jgi:hypothetical protein
MYRLKVAGNYNLVIKDLGISINAASNKDVLVDKEKFEASVDAQRLVTNKFLIVEDADSAKSQKPVVEKFVPNTEAIVVKREEEKKPENIFVRQPEETKTEEVVEPEQGAKVLEPVEVVEVKNETEVKVSEEKQEVKNTQKEEVAEKEVAPKKPATKKPAAKAKK